MFCKFQWLTQMTTFSDKFTFAISSEDVIKLVYWSFLSTEFILYLIKSFKILFN